MSELAVLDDGKKNRFSESGGKFLVLAQGMPIESDEDFQHADKLVTQGKDYIKGVKELLDPHVKRAHEAHRELSGDRNALVQPFEKATKLLGDKMAKYNYERELEKQKERNDAIEKAKAEQDVACEAQAKELEDAGEKEAAQAVLEMKETAVSVQVDKSSDHLMSNTKFKTDWISSVIDPESVPRQYLMIDEAKIQRVARAMKGNIKIAGVSIEEKQTPIRRGGK